MYCTFLSVSSSTLKFNRIGFYEGNNTNSNYTTLINLFYLRNIRLNIDLHQLSTFNKKKILADSILIWKALFHWKIESSFFHLNQEILEKLFNLIHYLIHYPTQTLKLQLSSNPKHKPHIKCERMNIGQCSFSLCKIIFSSEIVTSY